MRIPTNAGRTRDIISRSLTVDVLWWVAVVALMKVVPDHKVVVGISMSFVYSMWNSLHKQGQGNTKSVLHVIGLHADAEMSYHLRVAAGEPSKVAWEDAKGPIREEISLSAMSATQEILGNIGGAIASLLGIAAAVAIAVVISKVV